MKNKEKPPFSLLEKIDCKTASHFGRLLRPKEMSSRLRIKADDRNSKFSAKHKIDSVNRTFTNADSVSQLNGAGTEVSGSVGRLLGISIDVDYVTGDGYSGISYGVGEGAGGAEGHAYVADTKVASIGHKGGCP